MQIQGLPESWDSAKLQEFFTKYGEVTSAMIQTKSEGEEKVVFPDLSRNAVYFFDLFKKKIGLFKLCQPGQSDAEWDQLQPCRWETWTS